MVGQGHGGGIKWLYAACIYNLLDPVISSHLTRMTSLFQVYMFDPNSLKRGKLAYYDKSTQPFRIGQVTVLGPPIGEER